jgi:hypothetical protein
MLFVESVGGVDEDTLSIAPIQMCSSSISNVDVLKLMAIEAQVITWIFHSCMFIC